MCYFWRCPELILKISIGADQAYFNGSVSAKRTGIKCRSFLPCSCMQVKMSVTPSSGPPQGFGKIHSFAKLSFSLPKSSGVTMTSDNSLYKLSLINVVIP